MNPKRILFIQVILISSLLVACQPAPQLEKTFSLTLTHKGQSVSTHDSLRVLIIGNSITRNPPLPQIGWLYDWGMAASAQDKDFVHLLFGRISTHPKVQGRSVLRYDNLSFFERNFYTFDADLVDKHFRKHRDYSPDLVVFRWGDNTIDTVAAKHNFGAKFSEVISYFKQNNKKTPLFMITSTWYPNAVVNQQMSQLAQDNSINYIDLGGMRWVPGLSAEESGIFKDGGVASHPSDRGMQAIADSVYKAFQPMVR